MSNILFTFIFGGLLVSMAALTALLTSILIKHDMKKTFDFIKNNEEDQE